MAADVALFEAAEQRGEVGCRVYAWNAPWVSLGRFQSPDRDLLQPAGTNWVMRPTGGKAVLHGHDVTVGLAVPFEVVGAGARELKKCYRWVAEPIIEALRACGVSAALGERTAYAGRGPRTADCFTHVAANDIVDERSGVKVCGCALLMGQRAVLLQASIPNGPPPVPPGSVIREAQASNVPPWDASGFAAALEAALRKRL
jgi:lipoate-protein ligase A